MQICGIFPRDVTELFSAKLMSIKFVDAATGKLCVIHANNTSGVTLARLFTEYDKCDSRVRPLVIMFRYFAKVGKILKIKNLPNGNE